MSRTWPMRWRRRRRGRPSSARGSDVSSDGRPPPPSGASSSKSRSSSSKFATCRGGVVCRSRESPGRGRTRRDGRVRRHDALRGQVHDAAAERHADLNHGLVAVVHEVGDLRAASVARRAPNPPAADAGPRLARVDADDADEEVRRQAQRQRRRRVRDGLDDGRDVRAEDHGPRHLLLPGRRQPDVGERAALGEDAVAVKHGRSCVVRGALVRALF